MRSILPQLSLRPIKITDNTKKLSLGKAEFQPLKSFLNKTALHFHNTDIAKTYVIVDEVDSRVYGYITLISSEITLDINQRPSESKQASRYEAFPAVKIARLATDTLIQGKGIGTKIIQWCIWLVTDKIMPHIGCRFLAVDAKKDSIAFYEKLGFELVDSDKNRKSEHPMMFIDLYKTKNGIEYPHESPITYP